MKHSCALCGKYGTVLDMSRATIRGRQVWLCHPFVEVGQTCYIKAVCFGARLLAIGELPDLLPLRT